MKNCMIKKCIALFISLVMVLTLAPTVSFAAGGQGTAKLVEAGGNEVSFNSYVYGSDAGDKGIIDPKLPLITTANMLPNEARPYKMELSAADKSMTIVWNKCSGVDGYVIVKKVRKPGTAAPVRWSEAKMITNANTVKWTDTAANKKNYLYYYLVFGYKKINNNTIKISRTGLSCVGVIKGSSKVNAYGNYTPVMTGAGVKTLKQPVDGAKTYMDIEAGTQVTLKLKFNSKCLSTWTRWRVNKGTDIVSINSEGVVTSKGVKGEALISGRTADGRDVRCVIKVKGSSDPRYTDGLDFDWEDYSGKDADWFGTQEAVRLADEIVKYQMPDGGWKKHTGEDHVIYNKQSTLDNHATTGHIRYLAKVYTATGKAKYKESCLKGVDFLLDAQYDNGGWPQIPNGNTAYTRHITFNDGAMLNAMKLMRMVKDRSEADGFAWIDDDRAARAGQAFDKGLDCILDLQVENDGRLTIWCQQYDEETLEPAGARVFELPGLSTWESADVVSFLESLPDIDAETDERVDTAVAAAIAWFDEKKIVGYKWDWVGDEMQLIEGSPSDLLWARFYDTETEIPFFSGRDGGKYYDVTEVDQERLTGYEWYGVWPARFF